MPRRSPLAMTLSQHRLRDDKVAERIVTSTGLSPPALVVEFGAGEGILTAALLERAGRVVAIERDRRLWRRLRDRFREEPRVRAVLGDFREARLPRRAEYHVVANLPFAHTSEAMRLLLGARNRPGSAHLVMGRDAAMRWGGFGEETMVSVMAKPWFELGISLALRRRDFVPPPRTDCVLFSATLREHPLVPPGETRRWEAFVERGFGQGRGSVRRNLAGHIGYERFKRAARALGVDREARPGTVSFEQWLGLWRVAGAGRRR
ncbi:MAG: methyltransferase domain-containing protein [Dehalococcoidia bacterium]|nr:methyltransferase domain-containing protein [Dehalococcoidia bacterium]